MACGTMHRMRWWPYAVSGAVAPAVVIGIAVARGGGEKLFDGVVFEAAPGR